MKLLSFLLFILWLPFITIENYFFERFEKAVTPKYFPEIVYPPGNEFTEARWKLGKKLFFDPILSRDKSISCGSCHLPQFAFSDTLSFSLGVENRSGVRNAPSLANIAYHPYFNRDGGVSSLEMQLLVPIQEHVEFDFNIVGIADRMMRDSVYYKMSQDAYDRFPDPYVISRAIANFQRTLISGNSKFDRVQDGKDKFSIEEERGYKLFSSDRAKCSSCHSGFNFTNYAFENNGLSMHYVDSGRMRVTKKEEDRATFKVPTLRNIAFTAPYMHNGSIQSLDEVIEHYSNGIVQHKNLNIELQPLHFSKSEVNDLKAFLVSLSDSKFVTNQDFKEQ